MARRGVFGRLPRAVPSLTATIVSIAEQMLADQDRNIMDAWQNGGTYEGKPVTDRMVLQHWQERLRGVSRADPLYDTYKNNVQQLEYKIAYSKQYTRYLQGGRTDNMGMANFFMSWEKKVPRNSEFYRTLQQDAAGYVNLARSAARAASATAQRNAYINQRNSLDRQYVQPAAFLNSIVDNFAKANGLISTSPNADTSSLTTGGANVVYDKLAHADDSTVLYRTATGQNITVGWVKQRLGKLAPDLRFGITTDDLARINLRGANGSQKLIRLANQHGYSTDANHYRDAKTNFTTRAVEDQSMSVDARYWQLRTNFEQVRTDPYASNEEKLSAWQTYQVGLKNLARGVEDDNLRKRIAAESNLDSSQNSLAEDPFGLGHAPTTAPGSDQNRNDITSISNDVKYLEDQKALSDKVASGQAAWTTGNLVTNQQTGETTFQPDPGGQFIGVTDDPAVLQRLAFGGSNVLSLPSDWSSTGYKNIVLQALPVTFADRSAATGLGGATPSAQVATAYEYYDAGGTLRTVYGYKDVNGNQQYTSVPPWDPTMITSIGPSGVVIDATKYQGLQGQQAIDFVKAHSEFASITVNGHTANVNDLVQQPDGSWVLRGDGQGQANTPLAGVPITVTISDPNKFMLWTGGARTAAPQANEDFQTLTQAALDNESNKQDWQKLLSNPTYRQQYIGEIDQATTNPDGSVNQSQRTAAMMQAEATFNGQSLTPKEDVLFRFLHVGGDINVAPGQQGAVQNQPPVYPLGQPPANPNSTPGLPSEYAQPAKTPTPQPTLSNLNQFANGYDTLVKLGLAPSPANNMDAYHHRNDYLSSVQIAPANIKVPQPPPTTPPPAPTPQPIYSPMIGVPIPPPSPYGQHHVPGSGQ